MNRRHLDADERRLFPNSGFRHSELGSKIFDAPKAHKYKELTNLRVSAKTCPPSGRRVCVPSYLRLMFVGQPAKFMGMDVGVGHQCLIK